MSDPLILTSRRVKKKSAMKSYRMGGAFTPAAAAAGGANPDDFPMTFSEPEDIKRRAGSLSAAFLLHGGAIAILVFIASLTPIIDEVIIPVSLLRDEPDAPEPAPARKALAERRSTHYAPARQAVAPQIVNPRVVADASAAIEAKALDMQAISSVAAPTRISRSSAVSVDRVSAVRSVATARATRVDVGAVGGPVVRGPVRANSPVGPSVGPRQVAAAKTGTTSGTGKLEIGGGSSVKEGILSNRDVVGSPTGTRIASVDTCSRRRTRDRRLRRKRDRHQQYDELLRIARRSVLPQQRRNTHDRPLVVAPGRRPGPARDAQVPPRRGGLRDQGLSRQSR